jgi:hypothetical protein
MSKPKRYPVELRERSVRLVLEQQSTHQSQWGKRSRWPSPDLVDSLYEGMIPQYWVSTKSGEDH